MDIKTIQKEIHEIAQKKGWYAEPTLEFGEFIALCHSELSEALEYFRNSRAIGEVRFVETEVFGKTKPSGIPIELADCIIRILDFCEFVGIDMEAAIKYKMEYNKTRSYRHGNKQL